MHLRYGWPQDVVRHSRRCHCRHCRRCRPLLPPRLAQLAAPPAACNTSLTVTQPALATPHQLRFQRKRQTYSWLDWLSCVLPCVAWLRTYNIRAWLAASVPQRCLPAYLPAAAAADAWPALCQLAEVMRTPLHSPSLLRRSRTCWRGCRWRPWRCLRGFHTQALPACLPFSGSMEPPFPASCFRCLAARDSWCGAVLAALPACCCWPSLVLAHTHPSLLHTPSPCACGCSTAGGGPGVPHLHAAVGGPAHRL